MTSSRTGDRSNKNTDSKRSQSSSRLPKGRVFLDRLAVQRAKGIKKDVTFNDEGQTFGPVGAEYQSYIGVLARQLITISYKSWDDVPDETLDLIWDSVKVIFVII